MRRDGHGRFSVVVGHAVHVVGERGTAAEGGHGGILGRNEIANDDAHGAVAHEFAGGIVVGGGNFQDIAGGKRVAALIEERFGRYAFEMAVGVHFGVERRNGFLA